MNKSTISLAVNIGHAISVSRRARKIKQADLAGMAGIGMNTMVSIEKGSPTVQLGFYLQVLDSLGISDILNPLIKLSSDTVAIESMATLLPKRVTNNKKSRAY